jgi:transposase, IS5 family
MGRERGQPALFLAMGDKRTRMDQFFYRVNKIVDWEQIEHQLSTIHNSRTGRYPYPPIALFKMFLLRSWFSMTGEQTVDQVRDRVSFFRFVFVGLDLGSDVPDDSTLSRFIKALEEDGLDLSLRRFVEEQIAAHGDRVEHGSIKEARFAKRSRKPGTKPD